MKWGEELKTFVAKRIKIDNKRGVVLRVGEPSRARGVCGVEGTRGEAKVGVGRGRRLFSSYAGCGTSCTGFSFLSTG